MSLAPPAALSIAAALIGAVPNAPPPPQLRTAEVAAMPPAEDARIAELAQRFFEDVRKVGLEQAMRDNFGGNEKVLAEANLAGFRTIDKDCGKLEELELTEKRDFGTRAAKRTYVALHGTCLVKWDLTFKRIDKRWAYSGFSFKTLDGTNW